MNSLAQCYLRFTPQQGLFYCSAMHYQVSFSHFGDIWECSICSCLIVSFFYIYDVFLLQIFNNSCLCSQCCFWAPLSSCLFVVISILAEQKKRKMLLIGVSFGLRRSIHGCLMAIWAVFPPQPKYPLPWSLAFCQIFNLSKSEVRGGVDNKHSFSKQNSLVNHPDEHFRTLFYSCVNRLSFQLLQKKPWPINSIFFLISSVNTIDCYLFRLSQHFWCTSGNVPYFPLL